MKPKTAIILLAMILIFSIGFMYFLYTQLKPIQVVETGEGGTGEVGRETSGDRVKDIRELMEEERKIIEKNQETEDIEDTRQRMLELLSNEQVDADIDAMRKNLEWTQEDRDKMHETIKR